MTRFVCTSDDPSETARLGRAVGEACRGGELITLSGPLGAGKTHFTQGLARGLEVPESEPVTSPTFVLLREYEGRLTLYHLDAYRLSGEADLIDLGWDELRADSSGVVVLEWPERVPGMIDAAALHLELAHLGPTQRRLCVTVGVRAGDHWLQAFRRPPWAIG